MVDIITIVNKELAIARVEVNNALKGSSIKIVDKKLDGTGGRAVKVEGIGLGDLVKRIDSDPDLTDETHTAITAIKDGLTAYYAVRTNLQNRFNVDIHTKDLSYDKKKLYDEKYFINLYSLFLGANIITSKLKPRVDKFEYDQVLHINENFQFDVFNSTNGEVISPSEVISKLKGVFELEMQQKEGNVPYVKNPHDFMQFTYEIFDLLAKKCVKEKDRFSDLENVVKNLSIDVFGVTSSGFSYNNAPIESTVTFEKVDFDEDIIGNDKAKRILKILTKALLLYDPAKQNNVFTELGLKGKTALFYGQPGTGKTLLLKAAVFYVNELATKYNKPFKWVNITNADIKDKYFGESTKMLRAKLEQATKGDSIAIVSIEDIDAIFAAREELSDKPEEKALLQELMNTLEGMMTKETGNYLLLATSNKPANLDDALGQRLKDNQSEVPGPLTALEYGKVMRKEMKKPLKAGWVCNKDGSPVTDEQWLKLGEQFVSAKQEYPEISGRAVSKVAASVSKGGFDFLENLAMDELLTKDYESQKSYLKGKLQKVTPEMISKEIDEYKIEGLKQEKIKLNESVDQRVKGIVDAVKAKAKALRDRAYIEAEKEAQRLELTQNEELKSYMQGEFMNAFIESFGKEENTFSKETLEAIRGKIDERLATYPKTN